MTNQISEYGRKLEDFFITSFYSYGLFLGKHPRWFFWGPLLVTVACVPGLFMLSINLDLYRLFVPLDAPVRMEYERSKEFAAMPAGSLAIHPVLSSRASREIGEKGKTAVAPTEKVGQKTDILRFYVVHKDYDNLLESKYLGPLYQYTIDMMKVKHEYLGRVYALEDFCQRGSNQTKCDNTLNVWLKHADVLFRDGKIRHNPNLQLSYPVMYLFNRPKDIGSVVYGVNVTGEKNEIQGARVLTLHWFIRYPALPEMDRAYAAYRDGLMEFWHEIERESYFEIIPHNEKAMDDEMLKIIQVAVPFAFPATVLLMLFVVFSNWSSEKEKSKPLEMYIGVWSVICALLITFGIFFAFGKAFNPVTSTMPFLVLAIGVDDDFLMLATWRELDTRISVEKRIALVMGDAGSSITVTSFTNFFCFTLGYFMCSTPAVAEFCLITAFGVLIDYLMQEPMLEDRQPRGDPCLSTHFPAISQEEFDPTHHSKAENLPYMHKFFRDKFTVFIMRNEIKLISWTLFAVYTVVAFYGCCKLKVDISPVKYIRDNSPIQTFVRLADKYIWADNVMPTFYVMRPPDFRDPVTRAKFNEFVFRLEHTKYSIGRVSTNLWVWQYQQYLNDFPDVDYRTGFYSKKRLSDFFSQLDFNQYRDKVKIISNASDGEPCIEAFTFQTSFYGLDSWDKRQTELFRWRDIVNQYPEYDMFLSGIFSPFLIDQRRTIAPSSMQTIGSALAMMAIISFFFLPDSQSVFLMTWSLLSISMGVCGGLALLGSDLDSVSMGCIVMAIGLAVDFSVHVCYRYHRSEEKRAHLKVTDSLTSVGWPVSQAVFSTLIGLFVTAFVPAYLIRVFFQTVYLVNIIGLVHALIWLPQLISSLDPCERVPLRLRVAS